MFVATEGEPPSTTVGPLPPLKSARSAIVRSDHFCRTLQCHCLVSTLAYQVQGQIQECDDTNGCYLEVLIGSPLCSGPQKERHRRLLLGLVGGEGSLPDQCSQKRLLSSLRGDVACFQTSVSDALAVTGLTLYASKFGCWFVRSLKGPTVNSGDERSRLPQGTQSEDPLRARYYAVSNRN